MRNPIDEGFGLWSMASGIVAGLGGGWREAKAKGRVYEKERQRRDYAPAGDEAGRAAVEFLSQPAGVVELHNLQGLCRDAIGLADTPLTRIAELADKGASVAGRVLSWCDPEGAAEVIAPRFGLRLPEVGRQGVTESGLGARLECGRVWRRNLNREHRRAVERERIAAGAVRNGEQAYLSDWNMQLHETRAKHAAAYLAEAVAVSDQGEEVALADMQEGSISNPRVRFAELMTRIKGFELIAQEIGHESMFVTLTAPSKYHPSKSVSVKRKKGKRAYFQTINPAWEAAGKPDPREAADYLCRVWARVRSAAAKRGLRVYGLRVVEPHADGCPHWHMVLFGEPVALGMFVALFNGYACKEDAAELAGKVWTRDGRKWKKKPAAEIRFDAMRMDPAKGSAVGYVTKYLTKNLDGRTEQRRDDGELIGLGDDHEADTDTVTGASRARAWASLWGIRQFQFYGGAPVGIWRELRKLRGAEQESPWIDWAVQAADKGDWSTFVKLLGGPLAKRNEMPVRLHKVEQPEKQNRYGETACAVVKGVEAVDAASVITRPKTWRIEWRAKPDTSKPARARSRAGEARPSWTCDNNCTEKTNHGLASNQTGSRRLQNAPPASGGMESRRAGQPSGGNRRAAAGGD